MFLDEVQIALNSKELNHKNDEKNHVVAEGSNVRGRSKKRDSSGRSKSISKSKLRIKCYHYHNECHIRRMCLERQKENKKRKKIRLMWL